MIFLGADHRGFELKEKIKGWLDQWGMAYQDLGNHRFDRSDDYVDFAQAVARQVAAGKGPGILVCGSGQGVSIVANKFPRVRSVVAWSVTRAREGRGHEDANILSLPADDLHGREAKEIVRAWLNSPFLAKDRYCRRLRKVRAIEEELAS